MKKISSSLNDLHQSVLVGCQLVWLAAGCNTRLTTPTISCAVHVPQASAFALLHSSSAQTEKNKLHRLYAGDFDGEFMCCW